MYILYFIHYYFKISNILLYSKFYLNINIYIYIYIIIIIIIIIRFGFNNRVIVEAELIETITLYYFDKS